MLNRKDLRVRDPFIVVHENLYYLYATTGEKEMSYYYSRDLEHWEEGGVAFRIPEDFWADCDVWASEVHRYNDRYYLLVSLHGKNNLRGTQIAVCDTPRGPFVPLVDHAVTPAGQSCIDGSLYVQDGKPYLFYSHDWPDCYDAKKGAYVGEICAVELSEDLTRMVGEPWVLFRSDESPIAGKVPDQLEWNGKPSFRYGTDAPFVQVLSDGRLLLTWSPYFNHNYCVLSVISDSGSVRGPWRHLPNPLFDANGGHAMFFRDLQGQLRMCLHQPELPMLERAHIFAVGEQNGEMVVLGEV